MLTTDLGSTQTLDPCIGVAPAVAAACVRPKPTTTASTISGIAPTDAAWLFDARKPMSAVDLHPDRWPLQSTS